MTNGRVRLWDFNKLIAGKVDSDPHRLTRMGMISKYSTGYYTFLPLGLMLLDNIKKVIANELQGAGAMEIALPLVSKKENWDISKRYEIYEKELLSLKNTNFVLPPTSEEDISQLLQYKLPLEQFPIYYYQMQWKFRNELRCRKELLRTRQFLMNDLYSFDTDKDSAFSSYRRISEAYESVFKNLELPFVKVKSDPGDMKGTSSHEYLILHPEGEAEVYRDESGYNLDSIGNKMNAIEAAHTFLLGDYFTKLFSSQVNSKDLVMGCYGIGVSRLASITSMVHEYFPKSIRPLDAVILDLGNHRQNAQDKITKQLASYGDTVSLGVINHPKKLGNAIKTIQSCGIENVFILGSKYMNDKSIEHITKNKQAMF